MVIFNDLLQNHSVALFGWAIFHDPGQSRNTICKGYSYQNQWYNRSLKLTSPETEVVGSSLQSSLQFCQKIKKKKKWSVACATCSPAFESKSHLTKPNRKWSRRLLLCSRQLVKRMPVLSTTCMVSWPVEEPAAASASGAAAPLGQPKPCSRIHPVCICTKQTRN